MTDPQATCIYCSGPQHLAGAVCSLKPLNPAAKKLSGISGQLKARGIYETLKDKLVSDEDSFLAILAAAYEKTRVK